MFEVRDYIVMEGADDLGQPLLELWVDYLPGIDGLEPTEALSAHKDNRTLHIPGLSRSFVNLSDDAWRMIEITKDGVVVVCGPAGVMWRAVWQLKTNI